MSPDLTVMDFFLWGMVKKLVYEQEEEIQNVDHLKERIKWAFDQIRAKPQMILDSIDA